MTKRIDMCPEHERIKDQLTSLILDNSRKNENQEILAIASLIVGIIIALQDQTKLTPEMAMEIVTKNIQLGNQAVVNDLLNKKGGNA